MSFNKKLPFMVIYLAALAAFPPFSTDIYLASMPTIQQFFQTSAALVQWTLSLFFIGFALAQLLWGPLSDRIGRKKVIFLGVSIYFLASLLCAWSHNIYFLIVARLLQAIGACSGVVMAMAIVKDSFPEHTQMSKILSIMLGTMAIAPMVAPIIGSFLLVHINWQANFYFLAIYALLLLIASIFFAESHPAKMRKPLPMNQLLKAYGQQISCPTFLLATLATATNFSVMFAFIAASPLIYIKIYHLPAGLFGYFFVINASSLLLANFSLNRLRKHQFNTQKIISLAVAMVTLGAIVMFAVIYMGGSSIWNIALPAFLVTYGVGILYPELTACALQNIVAYTGIASSLLGTIRFILAGFISMLMGIAINTSALPLAIVMLILGGFTGLLMLFYFRKT